MARPAPAVPRPRVVHTGEGYRFAFEVVPDPRRDVLLISYMLEGDYGVCVLAAPRLGGSGLHNTAWVDGDAFAQSGDCALALVSAAPFRGTSAGFVGASDGWQDFNRHGRMTYDFDTAEDGNVALMCELGGAAGVLALGFNTTPEGARTLAVSSLGDGFERVRHEFDAGWHAWGNVLTMPTVPAALADEARFSAAVLKVHEDRTFPGATVASLSIPWGNASDSRGGYHLVWTRDAVEVALALLAIGQRDDAQRMVAYLMSTQLGDGHWHQNFYTDGRPFWDGVQLDETALPILLAARLVEEGVSPPEGLAETVKRAAAYLARVGPMSPQDRWEENPGANPFTLATEVAALVAAGEWLGEPDRTYARSLADCWNERIEEWCYVRDTDLARRLGVAGYYVRLAASPVAGCPDRVALCNRAGETIESADMVGLECLYLARLGLRSADDPRLVDSVKVIDALLRVETPSGPLYHRYNEDGYGEHEDGRPFDGAGVGRAWPLLVGERGHFALLAGEDPRPYLETMLRSAGSCGLLPEQVWDAAPIPSRGLAPGRPSGSAMPLAWAHAEFLKLFVARESRRPCERLRVVEERYRTERPAGAWHWRPETPIERLPRGRDLIIEAPRPFTLRFGVDGWANVVERDAVPLGLGMSGVRLAAAALAHWREINFTRRFGDTWEGQDYAIGIAARL